MDGWVEGWTISFEQFLQFCLAIMEMDSLTRKLGVLPENEQKKDSFGLVKKDWCDQHVKYMYNCGGHSCKHPIQMT